MNLKLSLKTKLYLVAFSAVFFLSAYFIVNTYLNVLSTKEKDNLSELWGIAKSLSLSIDGDKYFEMLKELDGKDAITTKEQNPFYLKVHNLLKAGKEVNGINTEIYTLSYEPKNKYFVYGVTSSDKMKFRHVYNTFPNLLLKNYNSGGMVPKYEDERGTWLSAFYPIKNKNGGTVCVIQVDQLFKDFRFEASVAAIKYISVAAVMLVLLGIALYFIIGKIVLKEEQFLTFLEVKVKERTKEIEDKNKEISSLLNDAEQMNGILRQNTEHISGMNEKLTNTLKDLRSTQNQLIHSEKMTSLGQFIAGVAHEINTPLSAINASNDTIHIALEYSLKKLPKLFKTLSTDEQVVFYKLMEKGYEKSEGLSSREERKIKIALKEKLEAYCETETAEVIAVCLLEIGVYYNVDEYAILIKHEEATFIFKVAYYLVLQEKNTININTAVQNAAKVVTALRSYTKFELLDKMEVMNIKESIQTVLTLFHNALKQGIEVNFVFDDKSHEIFAFGDEIGQIFTNIISNALYAMGGKGQLDISLNNMGEYIRIEIKDYGVGITPDIKDKIFDPFFTTKAAGEGNGLGLDIVKIIVERHKGKIFVDSQEGNGATFTVELPIRIVEEA